MSACHRRWGHEIALHGYRPYRVRRASSFPQNGPAQWGAETDLIELPWSWTPDDYVYLEFAVFRRVLMPGLRSPTEIFENFTGDVTWMTREVAVGVCTVVFILRSSAAAIASWPWKPGSTPSPASV